MEEKRLLDVALGYLRAGLCVLPACLESKRPRVDSWRVFQEELPSEDDLHVWLAVDRPVCLLTGKVSGNLEMLDFDQQAELYDPWAKRVEAEMPGLVGRLVVEQSQSGGRHVAYRHEAPVCGNIKLAVREVPTPDHQEVILKGKKHRPCKQADGTFAIHVTLIETRGERGLFVCAPSPGYTLIQGGFEQLPVLSEEEREVLLGAAWSLNEYFPPPEPTPVPGIPGDRPGDDFNERGDVRALLRTHGWDLVRPGENEHWRRPGKTAGCSATLKNGVFYVFSSNAAPFEPDRGYSPFAVYTLLEHQGKFDLAASTLRAEGYGKGIPGSAGDCLASTLASQEALAPLGVGDLVTHYPALREPVIHGLLRRGETMNVISAPKIGKSWLVTDLALAVATGRPWLDTFETEPGKVLIIDNELHRETSANRIPRVVQARGLALEEVAERLFVQNLRGHLRDIYSLGSYFRSLESERFKLVILDAFYRFMPLNNDENDNGTMATIYNHLDSYADHLGCSFVLIHHTSKGNQSGKTLTDVGAGAGSQSRATDTHLVLRPHEENDVVVLDAAVRSWPPVQPRCLRWAFPIWLPADDLDPTLLRSERPRRSTKKADPEDEEAKPPEPTWDAKRFVAAFVTSKPKTREAILSEANAAGLSDWKAEKLLRRAEALSLAHRWEAGRNRPSEYANLPRPTQEEIEE